MHVCALSVWVHVCARESKEEEGKKMLRQTNKACGQVKVQVLVSVGASVCTWHHGDTRVTAASRL